MAKLYPSSTHGHKLLVSLKSESVLRPVTLSVKGKGPCHPTKQDEGLESAPRTRWPLPRRCQHPDPSMMPCLTSTSCVATPARQAPSAAPPSAQSRPEPRCLPAMFSRLPRAPVQVLRAQGADAQSYRVTAPGHRQAVMVVAAAAAESPGCGRLSPHHLFILGVRFPGRHLRHHCWGEGRCGWHPA